MNPYTDRHSYHALEAEACNSRDAARQIVRKIDSFLVQQGIHLAVHLIGSVSVNGHGSDVDVLIGPAAGAEEWSTEDMKSTMALLAKEYNIVSVSTDYGRACRHRGDYSYDMLIGRSESRVLNFILVSRGVERWLKADDLLRFLASTGQHVFKGVRVGVHRMIVDEAAPC